MKQKPAKPFVNNSRERLYSNKKENEKNIRRNDGGGPHLGDAKIRRYKRPPGYRRGGYYEFAEKPKRMTPIRRPAYKPVKGVAQQKDQVSGEDAQQDRKKSH